MAILLISNSRMVATISMVGKHPHRRLHLAMEIKSENGPLQYNGFIKRSIAKTLVTQTRKKGPCMIASLKDNTDAGQATRRLVTNSPAGRRLDTQQIEKIAANGGRL